MKSWGCVELSVGSLVFSPTPRPALYPLLLSLAYVSNIEKALTASSVWHVLMLTELPMSAKCDDFIIPHLHFQAVFPFQHRRQVVTCFSAALTMDSVVTVFCNHSDESTSCLLEMTKQG